MENIKNFMQNLMQISKEFMRILHKDLSLPLGSLALDYFLKLVILKLDHILQNNDRIVKEHLAKFDRLVASLKEDALNERER